MNEAQYRKGLSTREIAVFAMLGSLMFISKLVLEWAPNIHLLSMLTMAYTVVYRKKALVPIYVYILINGLYSGFAMWWIPYLYIWTVLWGATMLLPKNMPKRIAIAAYMALCSLHGFSFGILYAPMQAVMYGLSFKGALAWIASGFAFDAMHGASNFFAGMLVLPCAALLKKLEGSKG
ncbi:MAG: hypothetical protein LBU32_07150 [Clostridiales bacterium]|jgi:hypothetical protein|nr:hypothetical protein [Clostridiales bacterium]